MTKLTWRFWLLFGTLAAGAHVLFGAGWSQNPQPNRSCGCLIELEGSEYCLPGNYQDMPTQAWAWHPTVIPSDKASDDE